MLGDCRAVVGWRVIGSGGVLLRRVVPAPRVSAGAERAAAIMAIDHRVRGRAWMAAAALLAGVPAAFAAPLTLAPAVEREIIAPEGAPFQPSPAAEEGATGSSEERRVGKERVRTCRYRWSQYQ